MFTQIHVSTVPYIVSFRLQAEQQKYIYIFGWLSCLNLLQLNPSNFCFDALHLQQWLSLLLALLLQPFLFLLCWFIIVRNCCQQRLLLEDGKNRFFFFYNRNYIKRKPRTPTMPPATVSKSTRMRCHTKPRTKVVSKVSSVHSPCLILNLQPTNLLTFNPFTLPTYTFSQDSIQ